MRFNFLFINTALNAIEFELDCIKQQIHKI